MHVDVYMYTRMYINLHIYLDNLDSVTQGNDKNYD